MSYAKGTTVSEAATMAEIQRLLGKYKADGFGVGQDAKKAAIWFRYQGRHVRFVVMMPDANDRAFTHTAHRNSWAQKKRTADAAHRAHQDEVRRLWRCLLAVIKAKFVAVADGVAEFDTEFLPYICMPDGRTFGEALAPRIAPMLASGSVNIPMLPGVSDNGVHEEAE